MRLLQRRGAKKRLLLWVVAPVVILLLVVYLVSNLALPKLAEKELRKRTRLNWSVAGGSWTPWSGVTLRGMRAELEVQEGVLIPPVLEVEELQVLPYWRSLFQRRPQFREVMVKEPKGNVPIQLIALMAPAQVGTQGVADEREEVPKLAQADPDPPKKPEKDPIKPEKEKPDSKPKPKPSQERKKKEKKNPEKKKKPSEGEKKKPKEKNEKRKVEQEKVPESLPSRIKVRGGEFVIYSIGKLEKGVRLSGVEMDVPIGGPAAQGAVSLGKVDLGGSLEMEPLGQKLEVEWKEPFLIWPRQSLSWQGLEVFFGGRLQQRGGGLFTAEVQVKPGKMDTLSFPRQNGLEVKVAEVRAGVARCRGSLSHPGTWRGEVAVDVRGVQFGKGNQQLGPEFDVGQLVGVCRQGVLNIADARLRSEQFSLMGNGLGTANGKAWAVMRIVASPEYARMLNRVAVGSKISHGWTRSWLSPFGTPDRLFRDLHVEGSVDQLMVDVGKKGQWVEVRTVLDMLRSFQAHEEVENREKEAAR